MDDRVLEFLSKHRVACLATLLPDGSPHAAALHFSHSSEPLEFYFSTDKNSRKCESLLKGDSVSGSMVVGFSEEEWMTLQLDGKVNIVKDEGEILKLQSIHYPKHPNAEQFKDDPETVFLKFTPDWWRFTDYNTDLLTIITSEE